MYYVFSFNKSSPKNVHQVEKEFATIKRAAATK